MIFSLHPGLADTSREENRWWSSTHLRGLSPLEFQFIHSSLLPQLSNIYGNVIFKFFVAFSSYWSWIRLPRPIISYAEVEVVSRFLGFSVCPVMSPVSNVSFFPPSFLIFFFSCIIRLVIITSTVFNRRGDSGIFFVGMENECIILSLCMTIAVVFVVFSRWRNSLLFLVCWHFLKTWMVIEFKYFFCTYQDDYMTFSFFPLFLWLNVCFWKITYNLTMSTVILFSYSLSSMRQFCTERQFSL